MSDRTKLDRTDFGLGVLSITAVVLFVAWILPAGRPTPALADGMTTSGGDYVVSVGAVDVADEEYVYVMDVPTERIIAYRFDLRRKAIDLVQGIDFGDIRRKAGAKP
ncbi:MAG: hypothetical protein D6788_02260 [Planctomycetota bacterium]|nr:MAG: hypothetical protein D6788_02260 [Planctomycetota bacterium]